MRIAEKDVGEMVEGSIWGLELHGLRRAVVGLFDMGTYFKLDTDNLNKREYVRQILSYHQGYEIHPLRLLLLVD